MKSKTIIAGLVGGVTFFLLGWIVYGALLMDFMKANYNNCANRAETDMIWWALILSNFIWGFLVAVVLSWGNTKGFMPGLQRGLVLGFLFSAGYDLSMHSMLTVFLTTNALIMDIVVNTLMTGVIGGVAGLVLGMEKKNAAGA